VELRLTSPACRLTAKNRDQLRNPMLGNQVWATFTFYRENGAFRVKYFSHNCFMFKYSMTESSQ